MTCLLSHTSSHFACEVLTSSFVSLPTGSLSTFLQTTRNYTDISVRADSKSERKRGATLHEQRKHYQAGFLRVSARVQRPTTLDCRRRLHVRQHPRKTREFYSHV
jgi:hypothetical protein